MRSEAAQLEYKLNVCFLLRLRSAFGWVRLYCLVLVITKMCSGKKKQNKQQEQENICVTEVDTIGDCEASQSPNSTAR